MSVQKPQTVIVAGTTSGGSRTMHIDEACHILRDKSDCTFEKDRDLLWDSATWCGVCAKEYKE